MSAIATPIQMTQVTASGIERHTGVIGLLTYPPVDLVKTDRLAHGGLDVEGLDVLPVLLEKGDKEVDA